MNTIKATCLQKNLNNFVDGPCAGSYGSIQDIPVGANATPESEYWAVPIVSPYFVGFRYVASEDAPTSDSIKCFKLINTQTNDYFMVVGTIAQYSVAAAACCDTSPIPSLLTTLPAISALCQETCTNDGTNYDAFFAAPAIGAGRYVVQARIDNAVVAQTYATGSTSLANLITYLNSHIAASGTWSNTSGNTIRYRAAASKTVCLTICVKTS